MPSTRITSGLRDRNREAGAWAGKINGDRKWIVKTLVMRHHPKLVALQAAIDADWDNLRGSFTAIKALVFSHLEQISDGDMQKISPHSVGLAVDVGLNSAYSKPLMMSLPNARQVLREKDHWHIGFKVVGGAEKKGGDL